MQNILITGITKGLGFQLAQNSLQRGYNVTGISRNKSSINTSNIVCDLGDLKNLKYILGNEPNLKKDFDTIILNAGTLGDIKNAREVSNQELLQSLNVNFFANKLIIDHFLKNTNLTKRFIFISSGASTKGYTGWLSYCCSKSISDSLIRVYAKEHIKHIFISISPGAINTSMQKLIQTTDINQFPDMKKFIELNETGGLRSPKEASIKIIDHIEKVSYRDSGMFLKI
tara:strand:+ start:259 stop:942 length:684 start_codon:yes stop_codon:yes gene_type:complete